MLHSLTQRNGSPLTASEPFGYRIQLTSPPCLVQVGEHFAALLGYTPAELLHSPEALLRLLLPAERKQLLAFVAGNRRAMLLPTGTEAVLLRQLVHKDGWSVHIEDRCRGIVNDRGELDAIEGQIRLLPPLPCLEQGCHNSSSENSHAPSSSKNSRDFAILDQAPSAQDLITICAWTNQVWYEGQWISIPEFLARRFGLVVTHGMSQEAAQKMLQDWQREHPRVSTSYASPPVPAR